MSDTYQAIYDAVRSRISNGDIGQAVKDIAWQCFDISDIKPHLQQEIYSVSTSMQRPTTLMRPEVFPDGNMWCALYGEDLQRGVCGFGETPELACEDFDKNWHSQRLHQPKDA